MWLAVTLAEQLALAPVPLPTQAQFHGPPPVTGVATPAAQRSVEGALASHPSVLEAAVVPAMDDDNLLKPKAFVVLKPGVSADGLDASLKEHVKAAVGMWKYPRWIEVRETLPKTATGKIQRFKLRALD